MNSKEFNLSDKIINNMPIEYIRKEDVKEFIRLLKEQIHKDFSFQENHFNLIINKLAGDKLK